MTPHSPQNSTSTTVSDLRMRSDLAHSRWVHFKNSKMHFLCSTVPCPYKTADGALVPHPHRRHCAPARVFRPPRSHPLAPAAVQRHRSSRRGGAALAGCPTEEFEPPLAFPLLGRACYSCSPGRLCATGPWASATACPHRSSSLSKTRWLETRPSALCLRFCKHGPPIPCAGKYTTKTPDAVLPQLFFASLVATVFIVSTH